jgi:hypothetical protein
MIDKFFDLSILESNNCGIRVIISVVLNQNCDSTFPLVVCSEPTGTFGDKPNEGDDD